jgi:acyl-lipid omega-6 desaturase (Delta-12 desaturase)
VPESLTKPAPADIAFLRASDAMAGAMVGVATLMTTAGIVLSVQGHWLPWLAGQVIFALALVQWFSLLHECGHETLFRTKFLNAPVGRVAAFFSVIPFVCWKRVHGRHHKWTGWQDVDPTTAALVPRELEPWERIVMNVCWRYWIPLFSVLYRINNFWNVPRLRTLFRRPADRRDLFVSGLGLVAAYVVLVAALGFTTILRVAGLALLLALIAEDLLLLSQHTHIPQNISHGQPVRPFPTVEQEVFTRSLILPRWLSLLLLHIDAHELHHMYPFVPGYRLGGIPYETENEIDWWTWMRKARAMPGEVFLFQNRLETGADL